VIDGVIQIVVLLVIQNVVLLVNNPSGWLRDTNCRFVSKTRTHPLLIFM